MSVRSPMSMATAIPVPGKRSAIVCASRSSAQPPCPSGAPAAAAASSKFASCTNNERQRGAPHAERHARIIVGNRVRYCSACTTLDSPWYRITPASGTPATGAIIPFHSTVGLSLSSAPGSRGRLLKSATDGLEAPFDVIPPAPGERQRVAGGAVPRRATHCHHVGRSRNPPEP